MRRLAWLGRESYASAGRSAGALGRPPPRCRHGWSGRSRRRCRPRCLRDASVSRRTMSSPRPRRPQSPLGSGAQITWTIANGFNLAETGTVTTVTGGLSTLDAPAFSIAASPGQPSQTATLTQTLPAGTTGVITLDVSSTSSNGASETGSGTFDLSMIGCATPCSRSRATSTCVTAATRRPTRRPAECSARTVPVSPPCLRH